VSLPLHIVCYARRTNAPGQEPRWHSHHTYRQWHKDHSSPTQTRPKLGEPACRRRRCKQYQCPQISTSHSVQDRRSCPSQTLGAGERSGRLSGIGHSQNPCMSTSRQGCLPLRFPHLLLARVRPARGGPVVRSCPQDVIRLGTPSRNFRSTHFWVRLAEIAVRSSISSLYLRLGKLVLQSRSGRGEARGRSCQLGAKRAVLLPHAPECGRGMARCQPSTAIIGPSLFPAQYGRGGRDGAEQDAIHVQLLSGRSVLGQSANDVERGRAVWAVSKRCW
jgi:hypothetical protein